MTVNRLLPLSGIVFVVLAVVAVVAIGGDTPGTDASAAKVKSFYDANTWRQAIAAFVLAASVPFLVFFAARLAEALAMNEAASTRLWRRVLLAGSIVTGAVILVTAAIHFALADGGDQRDVSAAAVQAINVLDGNTWLAFNASLGVMMLGVAGLVLPAAGRYGWLGWTALVLGIALFIPFADFIALLLTLIWIIVVSALLFVGRLTPTPGVAITGGSAPR
jgi:hypothetical protein